MTGLIVSVGITVDSYVVYFERLKDEVRTGRTVRSSVDRGFTRSFRTIVAADLVSLIGAGALYFLAIGSVRGFAFFLGISTILDLLISYFFMHPLVSIMARHPHLVRMRGVGIAAGLDVDVDTAVGRTAAPAPGARARRPEPVKGEADERAHPRAAAAPEKPRHRIRHTLGDIYHERTHFEFIERSWRWGLISRARSSSSRSPRCFISGLNLGIDFEGGTQWEFTVAHGSPSSNDVRKVVDPLGLGDAKILIVGGNDVRVQSKVVNDKTHQTPCRRRSPSTRATDAKNVSISTVGPTWGDTVSNKALTALIVFFGLIALYLTFRFEWKMALAAIIAVIHDIIITVGVYAVTGFEVTPGTVVAFLTILGFSLYDTVVVFDKVKENTPTLGTERGDTYSRMVNRSMNQVLMRSLNTSFVALLPVASLLVVGSGILGRGHPARLRARAVRRPARPVRTRRSSWPRRSWRSSRSASRATSALRERSAAAAGPRRRSDRRRLRCRPSRPRHGRAARRPRPRRASSRSTTSKRDADSGADEPDEPTSRAPKRRRRPRPRLGPPAGPGGRPAPDVARSRPGPGSSAGASGAEPTGASVAPGRADGIDRAAAYGGRGR